MSHYHGFVAIAPRKDDLRKGLPYGGGKSQKLVLRKDLMDFKIR